MKIARILFIVVLLLGIALPMSFAQDEELSALVAEYVPDGEPGVVILLDDGVEQYVGVAGLADIESGEPLNADDQFRIGSITKTFTATVILMLVDDGLIKLEAPISAYLPDDVIAQVVNADASLVENLLNMTSGIFSYTESDIFNDATLDDPNYAWTAAETVQSIYGEEPYFAVGEGYYYSNTNYNLLEMIIENVTGNSLAVEMEERIFAPLGMENTYVETPDVFAQNIVRGYTADEDSGERVDITEINDGVGLGDGGIVSTVSDLAKFPRAIQELLSQESFDAMKAFIDDGEGGQYGLGIGLTETDFGLLLGHEGSTSGFNADMEYLIEEDLVFIMMSNDFDLEFAEDIRYDALDWWFSE